MVWNLQDALDFIREYQPVVMKAGWCFFLGGGVLNRGHGPDLDILAYPKTTNSVLADLLPLLPTYQKGGRSVSVADIYHFQIDDKPVEMIVQTFVRD